MPLTLNSYKTTGSLSFSKNSRDLGYRLFTVSYNNGTPVIIPSVGTYDNKVWTGSAKTVKFTNSSTTTAQFRITEMKVYYE